MRPSKIAPIARGLSIVIGIIGIATGVYIIGAFLGIVGYILGLISHIDTDNKLVARIGIVLSSVAIIWFSLLVILLESNIRIFS